ncbi:MAG: lipoyl synthase [Dehalococcoidales bacterium]|nr:lipoyl synthase [Dehalococcoidales bacterium]
MAAVTDRISAHFSQVFDAHLEWGSDIWEELSTKGRLPPWFKQKPADPQAMVPMEKLLDGLSLHTICESALCPNAAECFSRKTATFLILGDVCTRHCSFCAVKKGQPLPVDKREPQHLLEAVEKLDLGYIVITSVTRDDLFDGGASHFVKVINMLHQNRGDAIVEVLVPDFGGSVEALEAVVGAHPEVVNHNLETVPRLYSAVRPEADYSRSLKLLSMAKKLNPDIVTKSGLMLGLGEINEEVVKVMEDLRRVNCDLLTIGQYLQPSSEHHPVVRFISPEEFSQYGDIGRDMGFVEVAIAPLVRSSFKAAELYAKVKGNACSLV